MRRLLAVLALGAVVVACSEPATSPQPAAPAAPSFDIGNAPLQTGIVVRYEGLVGVIWEDDETGLIAILGADAREVCAVGLDYATYSPMTWADRQLADRIMSQGQEGEVPTQVWAYSGGGLDGLCASIAGGAEPLATGVSRGRAFITFPADFGPHGNVIQWDFHGLLSRATGARAVFHFKLQMREFTPTKVRITLK